MKVLFDNVLEDATISNVNVSLNYPVANLADAILRKRYQASLDTDIITITFNGSKNINCFFYAYTALEYLQLNLYSNSDGLLLTVTVDDPEADIDAYHFDSVTADYATLYVEGEGATTGVGAYLGGVGIGQAVELPNPRSPWDELYNDNSIVTSSRSGQSLRDYVEPLRLYSFTFVEINRDDMNDWADEFKTLGIGKPIYIDLFEDDHTFIKPIYAILTNPISMKKTGRLYEFTASIKEAR